jgi:hypothetical protein
VFTTSPFSELVAVIPPIAMQTYVILMFLLVVGGTVLDVIHKKSAKYFFEHAEKAKKSSTRTIGGGEKFVLALKTAANEVLTSSEFCNPRRRIAHFLTMYGFILFVATTAILVFAYPTPAQPAPALLPVLWHLGALMRRERHDLVADQVSGRPREKFRLADHDAALG